MLYYSPKIGFREWCTHLSSEQHSPHKNQKFWCKFLCFRQIQTETCNTFWLQTDSDGNGSHNWKTHNARVVQPDQLIKMDSGHSAPSPAQWISTRTLQPSYLAKNKPESRHKATSGDADLYEIFTNHQDVQPMAARISASATEIVFLWNVKC